MYLRQFAHLLSLTKVLLLLPALAIGQENSFLKRVLTASTPAFNTTSWGNVGMPTSVNCINPIAVGELRVVQSKLCVDIGGYTGMGTV